MKHYQLGPSSRRPEEIPAREKIFKSIGDFQVVEKGHLFSLESINDSALPSHLEDVKRGAVSSFTRQSRNRLIREISSYGKLCPIFITLTYGKSFPTGKASKRHLDLWWQRVVRKHPDYWAVWKLEYQERGAPHYHLLVYAEEGKPRIPKEWIARSWAEVVGDLSIEKTATRVESLRSHRGGIWYATKYLAKVEESPSAPTGEEASEVVDGTESPAARSGRFWGVLSRKNRPALETTHRLSPIEYKVLLYDVVRGCARSVIDKERRIAGWSWEDRQVIPIDEDEVSKKMKYLIEKSKVPVHLMSSETSFVDRVQALARDPLFAERAERLFDGKA